MVNCDVNRSVFIVGIKIYLIMSKRKKIKDVPRIKKDKMKQLICDFFNENPGHPYNYKQVSRAVNAKNDPQKIMISQILAELAAVL